MVYIEFLFTEQYEHLQDELDRRREECVQLRTVLANASSLDGGATLLLSHSSFIFS